MCTAPAGNAVSCGPPSLVVSASQFGRLAGFGHAVLLRNSGGFFLLGWFGGWNTPSLAPPSLPQVGTTVDHVLKPAYAQVEGMVSAAGPQPPPALVLFVRIPGAAAPCYTLSGGPQGRAAATLPAPASPTPVAGLSGPSPHPLSILNQSTTHWQPPPSPSRRRTPARSRRTTATSAWSTSCRP